MEECFALQIAKVFGLWFHVEALPSLAMKHAAGVRWLVNIYIYVEYVDYLYWFQLYYL